MIRIAALALGLAIWPTVVLLAAASGLGVVRMLQAAFIVVAGLIGLGVAGFELWRGRRTVAAVLGLGRRGR